MVENIGPLLFDAAEMQQMIDSRGVGKTVILRFGSEGPLVRKLQAAQRVAGHTIKVDGDFGPGTNPRFDNSEEILVCL